MMFSRASCFGVGANRTTAGSPTSSSVPGKVVPSAAVVAVDVGSASSDESSPPPHAATSMQLNATTMSRQERDTSAADKTLGEEARDLVKTDPLLLHRVALANRRRVV